MTNNVIALFLCFYTITLVNVIIPDLGLSIDLCLPKPSDFQMIQLRQLFLVGSPCQIAKKLNVSVTGLPGNERRRLRYAYEVSEVQYISLYILQSNSVSYTYFP